jgi:serine/threonine protein kinase
MLSSPPSEVFLEEPPAPGPYAAGDRICGKYRLIEPIGFGGMGSVWRAHNEILDAPVALKLIRSDARWSGSSERLLMEARAAAGLRHGSIVRVFDFGKTRHRDPFIVMELLQGESLRQLLDRERKMTPIEAVRHLLPILGGISCAHARGIIHRDMKPENIFLARDDAGGVQPKILDFGIAKLEGSVSHLTTGGILLGSPEYMSPEQALGDQEIDHRVDIWSAAVVLYEMISGRAPWECSNCPALLRAIVDDPAPSLLGTNDVDVRLWAILERGLAKSPEKRWTSARNFGRALAGWLASRSVADDVSGSSLKIVWLAAETSAPSNADPAESSVATKQANETPLSVSDVLRRPARRRRMTVGLTAPLAAGLVFLAIDYHSSSAPAATAVGTSTVVVAPAARDSLEQAEPFALANTLAPTARGEALEEALEAGAPVPGADAPRVEPPPLARPAERPRATQRVRPAPTKPVAAPVGRPLARSMDFGF